MSKIQLLPPTLANQIAAGEIIERPSSVVKELIENSIDAKASRIEIEIEKGGGSRILIRDNGTGIDKDDLVLSLCRHATSKIQSLDDLNNVATLGFRGEALASISSVAKVTLKSATNNQTNGWMISASGNSVVTQPIPAAHNCGTTIEVRDLFFNTPARRKFMRQEKTELNHIQEVVRRFALGRFEINISLKHNKKLICHFRPASARVEQENRIEKIFGKDFIDNALFIEAKSSQLKLSGWIGKPTFSRSQADLQYLYINGRIDLNRINS